jgi:hypothetical protein
MPVRPEDGYEAIGSRVFAEEHLGLVVLAIATPQGGEIRLHMKRSTFDALAGQIAAVKADIDRRAPSR